MKVKIKLDADWEIDAEIPDEVAEKLKKKEIKRTGYERVDNGKTYYYELYDGTIDTDTEANAESDTECYETGNYYSDRNIAINNARATVLMRKLRRFAAEHRVETINNSTDQWYEIYYDYEFKQIRIEYVSDCKFFGVIQFDSTEAAQLAIDTFRDELIWYFTKYKDSIE